MLQVEAMTFIEEQMRPRFQDWEPNREQIADWIAWLKPYSPETARNALREHVGTLRYNKRPVPSKLRPLLAKFHPADNSPKPKPENTVFIWYEGGGDTTLQAGYFFPVCTKHSNVMLVAEQERLRHQENHGGEWMIYQDTTGRAMVKMRCDRRAIETNANWKKLQDVDSQTPANDRNEIVNAVRKE